jgi:hypothetical protein
MRRGACPERDGRDRPGHDEGEGHGGKRVRPRHSGAAQRSPESIAGDGGAIAGEGNPLPPSTLLLDPFPVLRTAGHGRAGSGDTDGRSMLYARGTLRELQRDEAQEMLPNPLRQ